MSRPDGRRAIFLSAGLGPQAPLAVPALALETLRLAEQARIDLLVLGESGEGAGASRFDPLIVAPWLAPHAGGVGLVPFISTLPNEPYHVARALSALDFLTRGRSGWQPGLAGYHPASVGNALAVPAGHELAKAREFVAASRCLWDGWDADALIIDTASGVYLDSSKVRQPAYRGEYYQILGPLNAARPPQGHPVLVQTDRDPLWRGLGADVLITDAGASVAGAGVAGAGVAEAGALRSVRLSRAQWNPAGLAELERGFHAGHFEGVHLPLDEPAVELAQFVRDVLPALESRGLLSDLDRGATLRTRLGLKVPGARS